MFFSLSQGLGSRSKLGIIQQSRNQEERLPRKMWWVYGVQDLERPLIAGNKTTYLSHSTHLSLIFFAFLPVSSLWSMFVSFRVLLSLSGSCLPAPHYPCPSVPLSLFLFLLSFVSLLPSLNHLLFFLLVSSSVPLFLPLCISHFPSSFYPTFHSHFVEVSLPMKSTVLFQELNKC